MKKYGFVVATNTPDIALYVIVSALWLLIIMRYTILLLTCIHTHTHPFNGPFSVTTQVSQYEKGKSGFYWRKWQWVAVASAGLYASLHLAPDRQPRQHPTAQFLQAGCPSCRPTNSVKALKAGFCILTYLFTVSTNQIESPNAKMRPIVTDVLWFVDTTMSPTKQLNRPRCRLGCGFGWTQGTTWGQIPSTGVGNLGEGHPCDAPFRQKSLTTCLWLL